MPTALVTGASSGLGVHFATALAVRGDDVILTARRADRLEALAEQLRSDHGVKAHVIALDLSEAGAPHELMEEIGRRDLAVNILINNAGFGLRGNFADHDRAQLCRMIDLNCRALMEMCHLVLPGMIQMRSGGILNVASTAAFQPGPWMAVYYATKAFVLSLSEALHDEVKDKGVAVAALCPGATKTEFAEQAGLEGSRLFRWFAGDADKVVRDGLKALDGNKAVKVSGLTNAMMAASTGFSPRWMTRGIAGRLQKMKGD